MFCPPVVFAGGFAHRSMLIEMRSQVVFARFLHEKGGIIHDPARRSNSTVKPACFWAKNPSYLQ
jgi:hypothetical protein